MLNESRMMYFVMVLDLEKEWQQTDIINGISSREIMKVHRLAASNMAK